MRQGRIDKPLVLLLAVLVVGGLAIFSSAAFGLLARGQTGMTSVAFNHLVLGVGLGLVGLVVFANLSYRNWKVWAPYIYGFSIFATALVFVPHIGFSHGGGTRWLDILGVSIQPSEALKLGTIIFTAAYYSAAKGRAESFEWGLGGFFAIIATPVLLLFMQPDIGTLIIVCLPIFVMYVVAGAKVQHVGVAILTALLCFAVILYVKPHARDRVATFMDPSQNQLASGYQIRQSLIAIGSGQFFGRGFGQGVQKFTYLPEPMGDSIFAVAGEEFGFIGAVAITLVFLAFGLRGFGVAARTNDLFGGLLAVGIATYLLGEAFINISAMLGIAPLTGVPLTFVSQGGSAMLASLAAAGVLLNVSRAK